LSISFIDNEAGIDTVRFSFKHQPHPQALLGIGISGKLA
jgi:hypothetical protein